MSLDSGTGSSIDLEKPSWLQRATRAVVQSCELEAVGISMLVAPVAMFGAHQYWRRFKTTVRVGQVSFMMSLVVVFMNCANRKASLRYEQRIQTELTEQRRSQELQEREMKDELEQKKKLIAELLEKQKAGERK